MGVATTRTFNSLGPPNPTKNWSTEWTFWANRYLEIMFSKFSGLTIHKIVFIFELSILKFIILNLQQKPSHYFN